MWTVEIWKKHIGIFRTLLGIYLMVHFIDLIPWAFEMYGHGQLLSSAKLNLSYGAFPNIMLLFNSSSLLIQIYIGSLAFSSLLLIFNIYAVFNCVYLWYGWSCLFNSNNLTLNPTLQYIGWLLLALAIISSKPEKIRHELFFGAWLLLALGYFISGIAKAQSPSWQDGSAIYHVITNPLARDYIFRDFLLQIPKDFLMALTYLILSLELLFLPLSFFPRTRFLVWLLMVLSHLGILLVINFTDLTLGMLLVHVFTFDPRWLKSKFLKFTTAELVT
jgi:hypothetical protein